jgi:WD40 repeat protein/tRNA A-37 threonylcarbamoyl transferase component Bud32
MVAPSTSNPLQCPKCGNRLSRDASGSLCVACIFLEMAAPPGPAWTSDAPDSALDPQPEARDFGPFELLGVIARGGTAVVYRALDRRLDREVALKVLVAGEFSSPAFRERFRIEARAAALLDHPNIVPIHEVGEHDHRPYLSMKRIEGGDLAASTSGSRLSPRETAERVEAIARAVHFAHQHGILHRDLKPSNILVDRSGTPFLTDFGLARILENTQGLTRTTDVLGTPGYMAPEQASGRTRELTTAADVWGLGAVLFHLLTGRPPFQGNTTLDTVRLVVEASVPRPRSISHAIPADLEVVCLKCLEKRPADRYPSAQALADDLLRWRTGLPIQARPSTTLEHTIKWIRRRPVHAGLLALIALVTLAGLVGMLWQSRHRHAALIETRRALYTAQMNLAEQAWNGGHIARVSQLLDSLIPSPDQEDLRGFEWHYFRSLARDTDSRWIKVHHEDHAQCIATTPDGSTLAIGTGHNDVLLVDPASLTILKHLSNPSIPGSRSVAFAPHRPWLAVASTHPHVAIWNLESHTITTRLEAGSNWIERVAFSPDGRHLAAVTRPDGSIHAWRTDDWSPTTTAHPGPNNRPSLAFSPNGMSILFASASGTIHTMPVDGSSPPRQIADHGSAVTFLAVSPDASTLASTSSDGSICFWALPDGIALGRLPGHGAWVSSATFSPDGESLVTTGGDGTVKQWSIQERTQREVFRGHGAWVNQALFLDHGDTLVTASDDGQVRFWNLNTTAQRRQRAILSMPKGVFQPGRIITPPAFSPESHQAFIPRGQQVVTVTRSGHEAPTNPPPFDTAPFEIHSISVSPDGHWLATAGGHHTVHIYNTRTGRLVREIPADLSLPGAFIQGLAFSGDSSRLMACNRSRILVWDVTSGTLQHQAQFGDSNHASNDRRFVGQFLPAPDFRSLWLSREGDPSGRIERVSWPNTDHRLPPLLGHSGVVMDLALSRDQRLLASAARDGTVRLWNARSGQPLGVFAGHAGAVNSVAFSPDDRTLASAGIDGTARLWSIPGRRQTVTLPGNIAPLSPLRFSPNGRDLMAFASDEALCIWSLAPPP